MAKQISTVSVYLHIRRQDDGTYVRELQRVSAVVSDPSPSKAVDKAPVVIENHDFGVALDEQGTVKKFLDDLMAAISTATGVQAFSDAVINRTTFKYLVGVDQTAYDSKDWLINPDLTPVAGVPQKYWKVVVDAVAVMDDAEKAVVDANVLQSTIDQVVAQFTYDINKYISTHYNLGQQQTLQTCWIEAIVKSWTNRGALVQQVWDWCQTVLDYFYTQRQLMWDATTIDGLNAVEKDFTKFDATDPVIIVETVDKTMN